MALRLNLSRVRVLNTSYFVILGISLILFIAAIIGYGLYKSALTLILSILFFGFILFSGIVVGVNLTGAYLKVKGIKPVIETIQGTKKEEPKKVIETKPEPKPEKELKSDVDEVNKKFIKKLSKKFRELPKEIGKRMEIEKSVAKHLQMTKGTFTISQLLSLLVKIFPKELSNDRRDIADEIKEWVSEDTYTQLVKKQGPVSYYELI